MTVYVWTGADGRVGAVTDDVRFSDGATAVEYPDVPEGATIFDYVLRDGAIVYDPLPEPEPAPDPVTIATEARQLAEEAKQTAEGAAEGANPQVATFARMALPSMAATLTDEQALSVSTLWPEWSAASVSYKVDDVVSYAGHLWRCEQAHTSQADWTPDAAPSLWSKIDIAGDGVDVWTQPTGAHNAYNTGDRVHYPTASDPIYVSLIDGNVWAPDAYPAGWQLEG